MKTKIAVVGCGPSGLCAIKNCISEGFEVVAFEQTSEIGGEWNSNLEVGPNVHSKIYEGLQINFPKELMEFSDFSYDKNITEVFLTPDKVQNYFLKYTEKFDLRKHIKFNHKIINVRPIDDKWEIIVKDLKNDEYKTITCDKVLICVGISTPWIPKIEGLNDFEGKIIHSRDYRSTKMFENKKVLLIGSGFSAFDIIIAIDKVAEKVTWVRKIKEAHAPFLKIKLSSKSTEKTILIKRFTKSGAEFEDGSFEEFEIIAFATGYDFTFPFLSVDSGISVYDKLVQPLYKQIINANRPSMAIIGLPSFSLRMPMFELQIKFCMQYWSNRKIFPSKEEMLEDIQKDFKLRGVYINRNSHNAHYLGLKNHEFYYQDLAETAGIANIKICLIKMSTHIGKHTFENFHTFRNFKYKILNDFEFSCDCLENQKDENERNQNCVIAKMLKLSI
ncbi:hypothetical protein PVAND_009774 [Polypedilum vanderplanki]|uniref:Flavin-containing monooxygenase n=1 Tax=Polypedilum vanderplanki TaxID=319348 RepID=A0A9J6CE91_POLVA|nr:hypothetical protein PVAND_009774 [Polypedilum vanderplanki]